MLKPKREPELQIEQSLKYETRKWTVERVSWGIMALLILAALLGLLGNGPLSSASASNASESVTVEYDRFLHLERTTTIRIQVKPDQIKQEKVRLWIDQDFLSHFKVEKVIPEPEQTEAGKHRYTFVFRANETDEPLLFILHLQPDTVGLLKGQIGAGESEAISFDQFVYP